MTQAADKQKNSSQTAAFPASDTSRPARQEAPPDTDGKNTKTFGERWLNRGIFALNWIGAFALTLYTGYLILYTKKGKSALGWMDRQLQKMFSPGVAHEINRTNLTSFGGHIMAVAVAPLLIAKEKIVGALNRRHETPEVAEAAQKRIQQEPKPTFWGVIRARIAGWVVVFASFTAASKLFPEKFKSFADGSAKLLCRITGKSTHAGPQTSKMYRIGELGAWDVFATTAATFLLLAFTPIMSTFSLKKKPQLQKPEQEKLPGSFETPAVSPAIPSLAHEENTDKNKSFTERAPAPAATHKDRAERNPEQGTGLAAV